MSVVVDEGTPWIPIDRRAVERRAARYSWRCEQWRDGAHDGTRAAGVDHALTVVDRLSDVVTTEVRCALSEGARASGDRELLADAYGSAAVALIAIEESRTAWLSLVRQRHVRPTVAEPFVTDLVWLRHEVERAFPELRLTARPCAMPDSAGRG